MVRTTTNELHNSVRISNKCVFSYRQNTRWYWHY